MQDRIIEIPIGRGYGSPPGLDLGWLGLCLHEDAAGVLHALHSRWRRTKGTASCRLKEMILQATPDALLIQNRQCWLRLILGETWDFFLVPNPANEGGVRAQFESLDLRDEALLEFAVDFGNLRDAELHSAGEFIGPVELAPLEQAEVFFDLFGRAEELRSAVTLYESRGGERVLFCEDEYHWARVETQDLVTIGRTWEQVLDQYVTVRESHKAWNPYR